MSGAKRLPCRIDIVAHTLASRLRWPLARTASAVVRLAAGAATALLPTLILALLAPAGAHAQASWPTYHQNAERTGLDPEALEAIEPHQDWQSPGLGAPIWSEPLILGGRVYVATVGDRVYALQADSGKVIWETSVGTPVPAGELPCGDITPTVGIVSTPVIDTSSEVLYAVADTWDASAKEAHHMLLALALKNGEVLSSSAVDPPGEDAKTLLQRSALNIDGGDVVFGFGGNYGSCSGELAPLVIAPLTGGQARFWQDHDASAPVTAGGVWDTAGASVNPAGSIYATSANPVPPSGETVSEYDYSDSVLELSPADFVPLPLEEALMQAGYFQPPNWELLSNNDKDLGSAGPELLPGGLLFQAGKDGTGYLIEEASMKSGAPARYSHQVCAGSGSFGGDAYADGVIYIPCTNGVQALSYDQQAPSFTPLWQGPADAFGPPILSAGLVWDVATGGFSGGGSKLYGLEPASGQVRYTETLPSPVADHFASPSAGAGRLFVASGESVTAFAIGQPPSGGGPGVETQAASAVTGASAAGAPVPAPSTAPKAPVPIAPVLLIDKRLRAGSKGRVRMALRCTLLAEPCRGTVSLKLELRTLHREHGRIVARAQPVTLARAQFGPRKGAFSLLLQLSAHAQRLLGHAHDRVTLKVVIGCAGSRDRSVSAVLMWSH